MNILTSVTAPLAWHGDALAIAVFADSEASDQQSATESLTTKTKTLKLSESLNNLDIKVLGCTLTDLMNESEFTGESGASVSGRVGVD